MTKEVFFFGAAVRAVLGKLCVKRLNIQTASADLWIWLVNQDSLYICELHLHIIVIFRNVCLTFLIIHHDLGHDRD